MIYLKPIGGLCNRMRTIDGMISICKKRKEDLTILWVMDNSLNTPYKNIFESLENTGIQVNILDCPPSYPEIYLERRRDNIKRKIKNTISNGLLGKELKVVLKELEKIGKEQMMHQEQFNLMYSSDSHRGINSVRKMDELFISKVNNEMGSFFDAEGSKYIATCYRMHSLEGNYQFFRPTKSIMDKVSSTTQNFGPYTIGLHIRRSDHQTATNYSSLDKFINVIDSNIQQESNTNVFLCTDDKDTKAELKEKYGDKILTNEVSSYNRNDSGAVVDAMVDLYCLSSTQKVYGSHHSSFSQVAADIGEVEEITVM